MTPQPHAGEVQLQFPPIDSQQANRGASPVFLTRIEPLLTAQEVAGLLRVPRSTIYELARRQAIPHLKVGRRTLFDAAALAEWIATRTVRPRS